MNDQDRFLDKVMITEECWIWLSRKGTNGYGQIWHEGKEWCASRLSYVLFIGEIPIGLCVLHTCDIPACVNPDHLYLGTRQDNVRDRDFRGRGRWIRGEKHGRAKLNGSQVIDIKKNNSDSDIVLASRYGVTRSAIYHIRKGYNWKHV